MTAEKQLVAVAGLRSVVVSSRSGGTSAFKEALQADRRRQLTHAGSGVGGICQDDQLRSRQE